MRHRTKIALFCLILSVSSFLIIKIANAEKILVIVNKSVTTTTLSKTTIADIYKNKKSRWNNGDRIFVVILKSGSICDAFAKDILSMTQARLINVWKKVIFTGVGTPPRIVKNEKELVELVSTTKGAIGYIGLTTPHDNVKVVSVK